MSIFNFNRILKECLYAVIALFMVLAVAEGVLIRFNNFGYNGPDTMKKFNDQGQEIYSGQPWRKNEFRRQVYRNSDGFHALEFDVDETATYRIAIIGDSFLDARQVSRRENFAHQVQSMVEDVQVFTLGFAGYRLPFLHAFYSKYFPGIFSPESEYGGINAVIFTERSQDFHYIHQHYIKDGKMLIGWQSRALWHLKYFLKRGIKEQMGSNINMVSLLAFRFSRILESNFLRSVELKDDHYDVVRNVYRERIFKPLLEMTRQRNMALGMIYIPQLEELQSNPEEVERIRALFFSVYDELGIPYIDMHPYLQDHPEAYFPVDGHLSVRGHQIVAQALQQFIRREFYPKN